MHKYICVYAFDISITYSVVSHSSAISIIMNNNSSSSKPNKLTHNSKISWIVMLLLYLFLTAFIIILGHLLTLQCVSWRITIPPYIISNVQQSSSWWNIIMTWFVFCKNSPAVHRMTTIRLAQLSTLFLFKRLKHKYIQPLYLIWLTRNSLLRLNSRYGRWIIVIMTENDFIIEEESNHKATTTTNPVWILVPRSDSVAFCYIQFLLQYKFHIFILISSSSMIIPSRSQDDNEYPYEQQQKQQQQYLSHVILQNFDSSLHSLVEICILPSTMDQDKSSYYNHDNSNNHHNKNQTVTTISPNIHTILEPQLGRMTLDGGIGMLIFQYPSIPYILPATNHSSSNSSNSTVTRHEEYVHILRMILNHMIFRKSGAIVSIISSSVSEEAVNNNSNSNNHHTVRRQHTNHILQDPFIKTSIDKASEAFMIQLIRSLHYEYREYGIDCIVIHDSEEDTQKRKKEIMNRFIKMSLQLLGCEAEIYIHDYLKLVEYVDRILS